MRRRPLLTRILVLALLLQWGTGFAACLGRAAPGEGFAIEICTAEGIRPKVLPEGEGAPAEPAGHPLPCPVCLGPAGPALAPPELALAPPVLMAQSADPLPAARPQPPGILRFSCQPRAPPTS